MTLSDKIIFEGLANGTLNDDHAVIQRREVRECFNRIEFKLLKKFKMASVSIMKIIKEEAGEALTSHNLNKTNNCQQIKKGEEVTLTTDNHLETRSDAEEDNKKSDKTADVDNQSVDNITERWGRGYARRSAENHGKESFKGEKDV